jgi:hypothetical protein
MFHHGKEPYDVAVSEAAKTFQKKLEEQLHASVPRVQRVIDQVENDVPSDAIVHGTALKFNHVWEENGQRGVLVIPPSQPALRLHDHALCQVADRTKIRNMGTVVREMRSRGEWGAQLVAHIFNETYSHMDGDRFLLRAVRGEARGFLSDEYRRLDSRPLCEAFIQGVEVFGARPIDGFALQTKIHLRAMLPMVFEPFPGEIMAFGAEFRDSDYGDGFVAVTGIVDRMWCTNLATTQDVLKKVHLGKRLPDNISFSEETYRLDTKTMASAVRDVVGGVLSGKAVNGYLDMVRTANEQKIESSAITTWVKKNLNKEEGKKATEKFASADIEQLPAGQTAWRWSNALSWLAKETEDERRKLELQELAGEFIKK